MSAKGGSAAQVGSTPAPFFFGAQVAAQHKLAAPLPLSCLDHRWQRSTSWQHPCPFLVWSTGGSAVQAGSTPTPFLFGSQVAAQHKLAAPLPPFFWSTGVGHEWDMQMGHANGT